MPTSLKKLFDNFGGESLRSPELLRKQSIATESLNCILTDNLSLSKRKGFQIQNSNKGGAGSVTFNDVDIASGIATQSRLVIDANLWEDLDREITITYSGTATPGMQLKLDPVTNTFKMILFEDGDELTSYDLGTGKGVADPSILDLKNLIDAETDFTASIVGTGDTRAAFAQATNFTDIPGTIKYKEFAQISTPTGLTDPFAGHWATRNGTTFENASTAQTNDVLYITNGTDGLFKYDGTRLYKAGLEKPDPVTTALSAGALTGDYLYRVRYKYTDAKDNIIFSELSDIDEVTLSSQQTTITIPNIINGSGYDVDGAIEIIIYRTKAGGSLLYEVATTANVPGSATQDYIDNNADSTLIIDLALPVNEPGTPPICRYVDVYRNQLILTGDSTAVNTVYYSDIEFPEGFSINNQFNTSSRSGGANSGIKSIDNYIYVFKPNSVTVVTGDLTTQQFQVDTLSDEGIGCLAHATLVEVDKKIMFLSRKGIYSLSKGVLEEISTPIKPYFNGQDYTALRSTSFHWVDERVVLFSLSSFRTTLLGEVVRDLSGTKVLSYDLETGAWFTWKNIDMTGGMNLDVDRVWFSGLYEDINNVIFRNNAEFLYLSSAEDFADHEEAISWFNKGHWETLGEPSIPKKFNRIQIFSINDVLNDFVATPFSLEVETNRDFSDGIASTSTISFSGGGDGWGFFSWGEAPWGELNLRARKTRLSARKSNSLRVVLKNDNTHENVLVSGYELEIYAPYSPALKGNI